VDVEVVTSAPAAVLAPFVDGYVGYRLRGFPAGVHRGLPSRHMTFIVSIGPGIDVTSHTDPTQAPGTYGCVLSGLQASPATISHGGHQEGVAIELSPLGSRVLLGMPARVLWNQTVECADVAGPAGRELWERLQGPAPWADRFAVCDDVLRRLARPDVDVAPELRVAWRALVASGGATPVSAVARHVGWSRQHLARRFGEEFGLRPKLAARVLRFERASNLLQAGNGAGTIAAVAAACGYSDQSHLDRDFAELAGCPPSVWLAEEVPSVQDELATLV
jgi:AraC-like DNA-binding protein